MTARPRHLPLRYLFAAEAFALFVFLTIVPIMPWTFVCDEEPVPGPYRPIFVDEVSAWFSMTDVTHWRIGDRIFLRPLGVFDGDGVFDRDSVLLNTPKISRRMIEDDDFTRYGLHFPNPPALRALEERFRTTGSYGGQSPCAAAVQWSPTDPPMPPPGTPEFPDP